MRAFIGLKLPLFVRERLLSASKELFGSLVAEGFDDRSLRLVGLDNIHLTLKFLGEVSESTVGLLVDRFGELKVLLKDRSERFVVGDPGFFLRSGSRKPKKGAIVWVSLEGVLPLQRIVDGFCNELLGFSLERRFMSHVTLLRVKNFPSSFLNSEGLVRFRALLKKDLGLLSGLLLPASDCEVVLYRSELSPEGPKYYELASINL